MNVSGRLPALESALSFARDASQSAHQTRPHLRDGFNNVLVLRGYRNEKLQTSREAVVAHGTDAVTHARDAAAALRRADDPMLDEIAGGIDQSATRLAAVVKRASSERKLSHDNQAGHTVADISGAFDPSIKAIESQIKTAQVPAGRGKTGDIPLPRIYDEVERAEQARIRANDVVWSGWKDDFVTIKAGRLGKRRAENRRIYAENAAQAAQSARRAADLLVESQAPGHGALATKLVVAHDQLLRAVDEAGRGKHLTYLRASQQAEAGISGGYPGAGIKTVHKALGAEKTLAEIDASAAGRELRVQQAEAAVRELESLGAQV